MTRVLKSPETVGLLVRVRLQKCAAGSRAGEKQCLNKTRMAVAVPLSDIEEDGSAGMGAVVLCGDCMETAVAALAREKRAR